MFYESKEEKCITFVDYAGKVISQKYYPVGSFIKAPNMQQYADFAGWVPELFQDTRVTQDMTFQMKVSRQKTVTFLDASGRIMMQKEYGVGMPIQAPDVSGYAGFSRWDPELHPDDRVMTDVTYKMVVKEKKQILNKKLAVAGGGVALILIVLVMGITMVAGRGASVSPESAASNEVAAETKKTETAAKEPAKDNFKSDVAGAVGTSADSVKSLEVNCYTTTLLVGDSIDTRLKADTLFLDGRSKTIKWSIDNTEVASIDSQGILTGKKAGTCNLTAEYGGKTASQEITVVDVDENSGATVTADFEKLSMHSDGKDTVNLTFGGNMPEHFGGIAYYSAGMGITLTWGEMEDNSVPLTIQEFLSTEEEGYVTVLVYAQENPEVIIASTKIYIRVN